MTPRSFTVETRGQAVVIFGGPSSLTSALIHEFLSHNIHAVKVSTPTELSDLRIIHDPDYLVMFPDFVPGQFVSVLAPLIDSGESRLVLVEHSTSAARPSILTPVFKRLIISDYVGKTELSSPILGAWLENIQNNHGIVVPGDGLGELSLLGENDLVKLLVLAVLSPTTHSGEVQKLGNPNPLSLLNLAYLVRTGLPFKVNLSFDPESSLGNWVFDSEVFTNTLKKLDYQLVDSVEENLKTYLRSHAKEPIAPVPAPSPSQPYQPPVLKKLTPLKVATPVFIPLQSRKLKTSHPPRLPSIAVRGLLIAAALYLGTIAFALTISLLSLSHIFVVLQTSELPQPSRLNNFATTYLQANWVALTSFPGLAQRQPVIDATLLLDGYSQALSAFTSAQALSKSAQDLIHYIFGSGNADVAQVVSLSRLQAEELYQKLSFLDGSLPLAPPALIPDRYQEPYKEAKAKLSKLKRTVTTTKALLATTPDVIGLGGRRKYAVLFQNNMELRATGGFIGSFAILSFENGKLYDMPIFDVYDADGQLKGHVEPPKPIKDILGEANWYLRDSNFDPDFPTSARRAEWFIKKTLNQDLDGTIAINVNTLVALLTATGPLDVPDYNETISGSNLYQRAQFHAEVNFFPGSTQKKEFLSTVGNALFSKLPSLEVGEGLKLVGSLADTIEQKNTLISLINPTTNHVLETLGWNGQLNDFPCPTPDSCHKDYAMVVDSNFGVNKANYFIKRSIEEVITFDKNLSVSHILRLKYQNTATSTAWPAGIYKNYQRLYLPIGVTVSSIKIGDSQLDPKNYTVTSEHNKAIVAYLVTVPINSSVTVEVEYTTPQLPQENELFYTWYWQKQPGTSSEDAFTVYLNYPMYLRPAVISPTAQLAPQQLKFDMQNDTDHRVTVKFTK